MFLFGKKHEREERERRAAKQLIEDRAKLTQFLLEHAGIDSVCRERHANNAYGWWVMKMYMPDQALEWAQNFVSVEAYAEAMTVAERKQREFEEDDGA